MNIFCKAVVLVLLLVSQMSFASDGRFVRPNIIGLDEVMDFVYGNDDLMSRAKALKPNDSIHLDTDADGDPDIVVWRDRDTILAALDEDDDLKPGGPADMDSDCWCADYKGDGEIDRVIDYTDHDGDNDADSSVLYLLSSNVWLQKDMACVVIDDTDNDNQMWFLDHYQYVQSTCQWKCDFVGNTFFVMGRYDEQKKLWHSRFEDPFCFYDLDDDGDSEVVIRFSADDLTVQSLRYSFDIDNDATNDSPKDYDFSITALGNVELGDQFRAEYPLRGGGKLGYIDYQKGHAVAEGARWDRAELCWDENDNNVNPYGEERIHERWEGVINHVSEHFPQVGGPSCGAFNKRYEVDNDFSGHLQLYLSGVDNRIHLRGAEFGWLDADYDNDDKADLRFRYEDTDGNGFFDTWKTDADGDGEFEHTVAVDDEQVRLLPYDYREMNQVYMTALSEAQANNQTRLAELKRQLGEAPSKVEQYWNGPMKETFYAAEKVQNSAEGRRYYNDLIIAELSAKAEPAPIQKSRRPSVSLKIRLTNPLEMDRPSEVAILDLSKLPQLRPTLSAGNKFVEIRDGEKLIPAQADDLDGDGTCDEIVMLVDMKPKESREILITTPVPKPPRFEKKTQANRDMVASIGWESNLIAYRSYYGKIDIFGKSKEGLILHKTLSNYHRKLDWGMDVLHIGRASGLGGLHVWVDGKGFPAMNEEGDPENVKVMRRVLVDGPVRTVVEIKLSGLQTPSGSFDLTRRFSICADQQHVDESLIITGGDGGEILYSPGLMRVDGEQMGRDAESGFVWNWFTQKHADVKEAGEVGMAILFPPDQFVEFADTDLDHLVKLRAVPHLIQRLTLVAGWCEGRRFQSPDEWRAFIESISQRRRWPVIWKIAESQ